MLKASGPNTVIIGLSAENIRRLQEGQPIAFEGKEVQVPGKNFLIVYGETEDAIANELRAAGILKL